VLDRIHSASEAKNAVRSARDAGFDNVSVDLMFGLPTQSMEQWRDTLRQAVDMGTDHISLYSLIVEDGTGFATMARKGMLALPSDDLAADMYQTAIDEAAAAGFVQYEISNFAKPGFESRHNLHYWRNDEYYGFGAGAVAFRNGARRTNLPRPLAYAKAVEERESLLSDEDRPDRAGQISETMFLGLRLTREGVDCRRFQKRFGEDPRNMFPDIIEKYRKLGLLESDDDGVRLTPRGVFLGNDVMSEFI
jgi:oxygen-independent coproporphyrinogen-3 oxidase